MPRRTSSTGDLTLEDAREPKGDVRLWLRLLSCCSAVEAELSARLRLRHGMSLARFEFLAQLDAAFDGLSMTELGERLMVTKGNITGMTDRLLAEGLIERVPVQTDRRVNLIKLTERGRTAFRPMAVDHKRWLNELFADLMPNEKVELFSLLGRARRVARERPAPRQSAG